MTDPIPDFYYLERYRNEGTRTYSQHAAYTEASKKYRPNSAYEQFDLPAFELPLDELKIYTADPPVELTAKYLGSDNAYFCIHPQLLGQCPDDPYVQRTRAMCRDKKMIAVIPSSSTRTVFVQDPGRPQALKVHFPFKISRYTRKMRDEVIEQGVNVSRELSTGIDLLDEKFAFLREVIGVVHKNLDPNSARGENWGYLVRDMIPHPYLAGAGTLIPGFALYGHDFFDANKRLLLYELIGSRDPVAYTLENIMLPIISHWISCFRQFGYLLEPHGQNVILELGADNNIRRIVHRDLSVGIDMRRRRDIGLSTGRLNNYNCTEQPAFHSITYDRFMGGHFFDRLVGACQQKYPGLSKEDFTGPCRTLFLQLLPEYADYFPKTVWYFSEKRDEFNKPFFKDTGAAPEWRP